MWARGKCVKALFLAREARVRGGQCMERVLVRQKLQMARGGACEVVSSSSLLGFARDRKICQYVP